MWGHRYATVGPTKPDGNTWLMWAYIGVSTYTKLARLYICRAAGLGRGTPGQWAYVGRPTGRSGSGRNTPSSAGSRGEETGGQRHGVACRKQRGSGSARIECRRTGIWCLSSFMGYDFRVAPLVCHGPGSGAFSIFIKTWEFPHPVFHAGPTIVLPARPNIAVEQWRAVRA